MVQSCGALTFGPIAVSGNTSKLWIDGKLQVRSGLFEDNHARLQRRNIYHTVSSCLDGVLIMVY